MLKFRARNLPGPRVYPIGAMTQKLEGQMLTEMAELTEAGCRAFTQADAPMTDTQVLLRAMEYASTFGFSLWLRPQDVSLARGGVAHDGAVASRLGLPGIPALAETVALATILQLARETGARVHLARLSTRDGIAMVRTAKAQGLAVTCDVASTHVHLSENDLISFDSNLHLVPPLRSLRDRDAIREALRDGAIDALCSDHTPVDEDKKQVPYGESEPGASGVELLLPLTLKWAREMGVPKDLAEAVELICTSKNVAHIDAGLVGDEYFIQRLYAGVPPEKQTSRDLKERYGLLAYAVTLPKQIIGATESQYRLIVDKRTVNVSGIKCYIVNSGRMGTGLTVAEDFSPTDGLLDVFVVSRRPLSVMSAEARFLHLPSQDAHLYYWRGCEITIEAEPKQAIWMDGEYQGDSPVTARVVPAALAVVAP
jgi:hypothetical protein